MPSVATSFFLPIIGAALPTGASAADSGFGAALASAVPTGAIDAAPPVATMRLPGFATPATLTALTDITPPPPEAPPEPRLAAGSLRDPQPAILVVGGSKVPTQNSPTIAEGPVSPKPTKTLPAILVAVPVAATPTTIAPPSKAALARQTPPAPVVAVAPATFVAAPTTTVASIDSPTPPATTASIADEAETPKKATATDAPEKDVPVPSSATLVPLAPPAASIVVAAAAPTLVAAPKLPMTATIDPMVPSAQGKTTPRDPVFLRTQEPGATDGGTGDPGLPLAQEHASVKGPAGKQDPVFPRTQEPGATDHGAGDPGLLPAQEHASVKGPANSLNPVFLRTQEPRVTDGGANDSGLLPAQEHSSALPEPVPAPTFTASASPTSEGGDAAERGRKTGKAAPTVETASAPELPIALAMPQPTPPTPASPVPAAGANAVTNSPAPIAGAGSAAALDPVPPAPTVAYPEFASRVVAPAEPRAAAPAPVIADPAPVAIAPSIQAMPTPAPQIVAATIPPPREAATVTAELGKIGREMGVVIARHAATGGGEAITVRLDPKEMGRIDVTLSFDDDGRLRAVVAADNPAALDLLRRDSADLNRALSDAGVRADPQSLRFDTRSGGGEQASSGQSGQRREQARPYIAEPRPTDLPDESDHRPRVARGGIDMMA